MSDLETNFDRYLERKLRNPDFRARFEAVEDHAQAKGGWEAQDLEGLEAAWQAAKRRERDGARP